jgi:NADH:quinone reductase (non-electrogenic)
VTASPLAPMLAAASGAGTNRSGRIEVLPDCSLPGHPEAFAIGDMMAVNQLPGVAEVALQSGIHAAATIKRRVTSSGESKPFKYRDLGSMASIARSRDERTISMLQASARVVAASAGIKPGEEDIHKLAEHDPKLASTLRGFERDVDESSVAP